MSNREDPIDELVIPDGTTVEEHDLVTDNDVIIGGQTTIGFGVRGRNILAGERVQFDGGIESTADCRLDMWCDVADSVLVGKDAYLGERVHIGGQLMVSGDLDIGDDVQIDEGFEANGWIVIRNPMPALVFFVIYLSHLLRLGEEETANELVSEMLDADGSGENDPVVIPRSSHVSDDAWRVSTPARIGSNCRLHGNVRASEITIGSETNLFGSLRARGDIRIGSDSRIHGDVTTRGGNITISAGTHILGDVACEDLILYEGTHVDGTIRSRGEMQLVSDGERDPE